jgi:hypothetical protein
MGMSNIVNLGDYRLTHDSTKYNGGCAHKNMQMDDNGHTVKCDDCSAQLSAYFVLGMILHEYSLAMARIQRDQQELRRQSEKALHMKIPQKLEKMWRGNMVPCCPHCGEGVLLTDNFGNSAINKSIVIRRRQAKAAEKVKAD